MPNLCSSHISGHSTDCLNQLFEEIGCTVEGTSSPTSGGSAYGLGLSIRVLR